MSRPLTVRTTQADVSPGMIDLALGHPSPALLPVDLMRQAAEHRLGSGEWAFLQYGYEQGDGHFRRVLAEFLSRRYARTVDENQLFITSGVSQALDLLCTLFSEPGDTVFVEEPTYFLALRIFADHRLRTVSISTDAQGLVVEALEKQLGKQRPAFLYLIPTHQNPTGASLPAERRRRIAELSRDWGFLVVADEVYQLLTYEGPPPVPMSRWLGQADLLSLGSFSKILAPGLRLGWIEGRGQRLRPLLECGMLDSGGGLNPFTSALVRSVIELGLQERHLERLQHEYGRRLKAMGAALHEHLQPIEHRGEAVRFSEPTGGFFFWLTLPGGMDAEALLPPSRRLKVRFAPGRLFSAAGGLRDRLRLSFSYHRSEELSEGVRRLAEALRGSSSGRSSRRE